MHNIVTVAFKDSNTATANGVRQWDYGQILRIQGLQLPTAVEVHFAIIDSKDSVTRIGTTKDGVTDVVIPDSMIEAGKNIFAYVYLRDSESGQTEYEIKIVVTTRAKPEAFDTPEDKELFAQAIEAVNEAADRAEKAGQAATEAAGQAAEDAQQTAEDRKEVAKMVETVTDISEQVKKVEDLSNKAQAAATKTEADAQRTAEDRAEVGKMLETVKDVSEQVKTVDESVRKAKESEQAAEGHRTAVEEMKNSVEQTASTFPQKVQEGVQAIENAGASEVQEITQAGTAQKTAVEAAGTQAVESVENVQQVATEAVETVKTEAIQAVQEEGTTQTGNVTTEGTKQVKAVQDKGNEVLQSIPEDFQMQMESKLDKQQGVENKGKALVIGEDGNVAPGEVQSGGGDGIAIINTMSGESPLVIPDSAERVNKGLELGGKTEQVQTSGKQMLNEELLKSLSNYTSNGLDYYYHRISGLEVGKKYTISRGDVKTGKNALLGISVNQESTNKAKFLVYDGLGTSYNNASITWEQTTGDYVDILFSINANVAQSTQEKLTEFWGRISYVQLEEGSTATANEPYTGGKPSPSPEYLQEFKNSGKWNDEKQKYEVDVKVFAGNLFDGSNSKKGFFTGEFGGQISLITSQGYSWESKIDTLSGVKVTLSVQSNVNTRFRIYATDINGMILYKYEDSSANQADNYHTFVIPDKTENLLVSVLEISDSKDAKIILNVGENRLPNAIYKAPQSLTLTSDRPLTKWDRLVEQGGQIGWLYQSAAKEYIGDNSVVLYDTGFYFKLSDKKIVNGEGYCKELKQYVPREENPCIAFNMSTHIYAYTLNTQEIYGSTVSAIKEYLKSHPLHLAYKTETPEFAPLPQSEQNAIRALETYYPTTVITVDGGELYPDIKVTYTADTKNYIDGKVSAKVASILRQYQADTANLLSLMPMETQATMIENDTNNILNNLESEETHE